jgi:hypothetical protein
MTPHRNNLQCRFISGIRPGETCDERTLEIAKGNLTRGFRVVGLCERFQESLWLNDSDVRMEDSFLQEPQGCEDSALY